MFFINNHFERIINAREASLAVIFLAEQIYINNLTIKDTVISSIASIDN
jgi:hypothetical protein